MNKTIQSPSLIRRAAMTLLLAVMTTTAWATQPDNFLDQCYGTTNGIHIQGWAYDPDASSTSIDIHVYVYTDEACQTQYGDIHVVKANVSRPDVNQAKGITGDHGFDTDIPIADHGTYWVKLFAIDTNGDGDPQIGATTTVTVADKNVTLIGSTEDWNVFADNVKNGKTYEGELVKLTNDISVTTMVKGIFRGTFDGDGHTLTVNLSGYQGVALFYDIVDATIQRVIVEGLVTAKQLAPATFAAYVGGNCTIKNCWSKADITCTYYTYGVYAGAMVANNKGTVNIIDCAFTGTMSFPGGYCGGMVGCTYDNTPTNLTSCLFAPSALEINEPIGSYVFATGETRANLTRCYYNSVAAESMLNKEGNDASGMSNDELLAALGAGWEIAGSEVVPNMNEQNLAFATTLRLQSPYIASSSPFNICYTVTAVDGTTLTEGTHFTAAITDSHGETVTGGITAEGSYTLTLTGISPYTGSTSGRFEVIFSQNLDNATISGLQSPYKARSNPFYISYTVTAIDGTTLTEGTDFTATIIDSNDQVVTGGITTAGTYTLTLTGISPYTGSTSGRFEVVFTQDLTLSTITGVESSYWWNGTDVERPTVTVKNLDGDLVLAAYYTVTIRNSSDEVVDGDLTAEDTYTLTVEAISGNAGGYTGSQTTTFAVSHCPPGLSIDADFDRDVLGYYYVNMPSSGIKTITLPDGFTSPIKIYDDGGKNGNFSSHCNGYVQLICPEGFQIQLSGELSTSAVPVDALTVFDGTDTSDSGMKLIDQAYSQPNNGDVVTIPTVFSGENSLTIYFVGRREGFAGINLTAEIIRPTTKHDITVSSATGGRVTADKSSALVGDKVTLTTETEAGYVLCDLSVTDGNSKSVGVSDMRWYAGTNTATFRMPNSEATVIPTFTKDLTAEGGLYINMPTTGIKYVTAPEGVSSFKVYDDGGKDGNYSNYCDGYLQLTCPEGYGFLISGSVQLPEDESSLVAIYDGTESNKEIVLMTGSLPDAGDLTDIYAESDSPIITSSDNVITIRFRSIEGGYAGIDLTVTIYKFIKRSIIINSATGGSLTSDCETAVEGQTITLTALPDEGMFLRGISIVDENGKDVRYQGNYLYPNEFIFFMPSSAVTVTPTFGIALADNADNSSRISRQNAVEMDAMLKGRTLWKDGDWNTLCLPFNVVDGDDTDGISFSGTPLEGAIVKTLGSSEFTDGTLTLNFTDVASIEAGRPYIVKWQLPTVITNTSEWNSFASAVNDGTESYAGKLVKLGADIDVSTMVGTADHPFRGIFDGNGHTLNVCIDNATADYAAPFRYIRGATIRNLKVTGSVSGGPYCAGIVGAALGGTNLICDCWMTVAVKSLGNNIGGILGHGTTSVVTISRCYLTGILNASAIGVFCGGGSDGGTFTAETCWALGEYNYPFNVNATDVLNLVRADGGTISVTNCRHYDEYITQGSQYALIGLPNEVNHKIVSFLGNQWTVANDKLMLKPSAAYYETSIVDPLFTGVTIDNSAEAVARTTVAFTGGKFVGTYSPVALPIDDKSNLYVGAGNTLYWPNGANNADGNYYVNACRAYFHINDGAAATLKRTVLNFGDGTTSIDAASPKSSPEGKDFGSPLLQEGTGEALYDLSGRRVNGQLTMDNSPLAPGIYIRNGKKIIVK